MKWFLVIFLFCYFISVGTATAGQDKAAYLSEACRGCGKAQAECCCVIGSKSLLKDVYTSGSACLDVSACVGQDTYCSKYEPSGGTSTTSSRLNAATVGLGALVLGGLGFAVANL